MLFPKASAMQMRRTNITVRETKDLAALLGASWESKVEPRAAVQLARGAQPSKVSAGPSRGLKGQAASAADAHGVGEENSLVKV